MNKSDFFDAVFPHPKIEDLMWNLDNNKLLEARSVLADIIDDIKPEYDYLIDDGEMRIYNAKIRQLKKLEGLYTQLEDKIKENAKVSTI